MAAPKISQSRASLNAASDLSRVFLACVDGSNEAIMLTDVRGTIVYVNGAWQHIYGFSKGEAIGSTPRLLRSGHHDEAFYARMWEQILDPQRGYWKGEVVN